MRALTPSTTFSKELGKIIIKMYLRFSSLGAWLVDNISLEVREEELARAGTVRVLS